jgi:hypothetical protein
LFIVQPELRGGELYKYQEKGKKEEHEKMTLFERKRLMGMLIITIVLASIFATETMTMSTIDTNATEVSIESSPAPTPSQAEPSEPSYSRGRDSERWAYPNGTMTMITYMGPRFVRHYATGEFVNLVFEDHRSEGYCLLQNSYIGLKVYDNRTVLYAPDMDEVAVDEAFFVVQVYNRSAWLDLDLGAPSLRVDVSNSSAVVLTQVYSSSLGRLEVSYIVRDGELLKYNIVFTSLVDAKSLFRVVQRFLGVHGANVTYGDVEDTPINGSREFIAPFFAISQDKPVLSVYLQDLGRSSVGGWVSDKLEKIALSASAEGIDAEVIMGNYSLGRNEALKIDPLVTTVPIIDSYDDVYLQFTDPKQQPPYPDWSADASEHYLKFGCHEDLDYYYVYRLYMRWPILIPDGCVVQNAYLNVCASEASTYSFTPKIRVLNFDNCPPFNGNPQIMAGYGTMSNYVSWPITTPWGQNQWVNVTITQSVQDFMNRPGYALGNYMGLRVDNESYWYGANRYRNFYSYDAGASKAPKLVITFQAQKETFAEPLKNWSFEDDSAWSADNLLLHMDEGAGKTAYDSGPNINDGTLNAHHGTVYSASWVNGKYGKALSFDGVDDYVGNIPVISIANKFTISAWVYFVDGQPAGDYGGIVHHLNGNYYYNRFLIKGATTVHWQCQIGGQVYNHLFDTPSDQRNAWHHYVLTYDGSYVRFYWDGAQIGNPQARTGNLNSGSTKLTIGWGAWQSNAYHLNGKIDEVRVYNRALSAPEVSSLFDGADIRNGLVGEWRFDEGSGISAADTHMWDEGKYGKALNFDGLDDYVTVPHSSSLSIAGSEITMEMWIYPHNSTRGYTFLLKKQTPGYDLWLLNNGKIYAEIYHPNWQTEGYTAVTGNTVLQNNQWYHVKAVYKQNQYFKIYLNGVEDGTVTAPDKAVGTSNNELYIGYPAWMGSGNVYFDGLIDEVRISDGKTNITVSDDTYMHGKRSWKAEGSSNQNATIAQLLDKEVTEYVRNRKDNQNRGVAFSFWYKPDGVILSGEKNKAYAEIVYKTGSSWQTKTGSTVKPDNGSVWWHGLVYAPQLPTNTEAVKVRIVGMPYSSTAFKAWIDLASLSVYYYDEDMGTCGNATLIINIYYSNAIPHPEWDGFVSLGFGIAAKAKNTLYTVAQLKDLKVELLPNNGPGEGSSTTQQGRLMNLYLTQENSRNVTIRDLPLTGYSIGLDAGQIVTSLVFWCFTTAVTIVFGGAPIPGYAALVIGGGFAAGKTLIRSVALQQPLAIGGGSYSIYETLDYGIGLQEYGDRIDHASASYYFDWRFRTDSDDIFAIKVSGEVVWLEWYDPDPYTPGDEHWKDAGETLLSTVISLANYWQ